MLAIFYVLLALTVIVSLFGIVNTLVLSVMERTREVGMLRAIGMTRRQTRRMVRHEGIVTAQLGAVTGMVIGVALGAAVTLAMRGIGMTFTLPIGSLIAFAVVATVAGMHRGGAAGAAGFAPAGARSAGVRVATGVAALAATARRG